MPTYEYDCAKCHERFEVFQSFSEDPLKRHRGCGGKLSKVLGAVGIVLKGSGFYRNDSRSESSRPSGDREKSGTSADSSSGKKSDSTGSKGSDGSKSTNGSSSSSGSGSSKSSSKSSPKSSGSS